jgi:hypothetical protein
LRLGRLAELIGADEKRALQNAAPLRTPTIVEDTPLKRS